VITKSGPTIPESPHPWDLPIGKPKAKVIIEPLNIPISRYIGRGVCLHLLLKIILQVRPTIKE
jgi:hypothetical protein